MPCAIRHSLTMEVVRELKENSMVCGCENDQLASPEVGAYLHERNIAYAHHYVINGGGLMTIIGGPVLGMTNDEIKRQMIDRIGERVVHIYYESMRTNTPASVVADAMVQKCVDMLSLPG